MGITQIGENPYRIRHTEEQPLLLLPYLILQLPAYPQSLFVREDMGMDWHAEEPGDEF